MLRNTIVLHGALADEFGGPYDWAVTSPRDAARALQANFAPWRERTADMLIKVIRCKPGSKVGLELDESEVHIPAAGAEFHFIPLPAGAKKGFGKAILGIALVGATLMTAGAAAPAGAGLFGAEGALATTTIFGINSGTLALFGLGIAFSGLSMMLAPTPKMGNPNDREQKGQSFLFNGVVNVQEQGQPVPLVYGRMLVGSVVISSGLYDENISVEEASYDGTTVADLALYPAASTSLT